ncbi:plasmid mobilization protein [Holdemanella porci]|uniref:plasmid mobilization protein n=1 Tax=Holdemanella porci TaxID=2652276 RepID=UPI003AB72C64
MPGLNKNRKRPVTIAFRVTVLEAQRINQRVKISGLSRRKYFMNTFLGQKIELRGSCFESNRLASELKKIRMKLEVLEVNSPQMEETIDECYALLSELSKVIKENEPVQKEVPAFTQEEDWLEDVIIR